MEVLILLFAVLGTMGVYRAARRQPSEFVKALGATALLCTVVVMFALGLTEYTGPGGALGGIVALLIIIVVGVVLIARYLRPKP